MCILPFIAPMIDNDLLTVNLEYADERRELHVNDTVMKDENYMLMIQS